MCSICAANRPHNGLSSDADNPSLYLLQLQFVKANFKFKHANSANMSFFLLKCQFVKNERGSVF